MFGIIKNGLLARFILSFVLLFHFNQAYETEREDGLDCSKCPTEGGKMGILLPTTILQLCVVVDNTLSFLPYKAGILSKWPDVMAGVGIYHALTNFGLVSFVDWPPETGAETDFLESIISLGNDPESCYQRRQAFTIALLSAAEFMVKFPLMIPEGSGGKESSLAAIAFAAADPEMNWDLRDEPMEIQRLFLLLTDADYGYNLTDPGDRGEFKGDGTDTCETSKPPPPEKVGELLVEKKMAVLALLPPGATTLTVDTAGYYRHHFEKMPHVPYCGLGIDLKFLDPVALISSLLDCFVVLFGIKQESDDCCVKAEPKPKAKAKGDQKAKAKGDQKAKPTKKSAIAGAGSHFSLGFGKK